jgi:hypothetical protein
MSNAARWSRILACAGVLLAAPLAARASLTLKAAANGSYVSADQNQGSILIADRPAAKGWEQFDRIDNADGTVSFRAVVNGLYVAADLNRGGQLVADRPAASTWEKFKLMPQSNGTVSLQALANGQFVSADLNLGGVLVANRAVADTWEQFTIAASGSTTCATLPDAPAAPAVSGITSSGVTLTWSAPGAGSGCAITGYRVYQGGTSVAAPTATSASVDGLAASTTYSFAVAAVNAFGVGPQSPAVSATTRALPSGAGMEIMTWVPSYSQSTWKAALNANTGGPYSPRNTLTRLAGQFFQVQSSGALVAGVSDADIQWTVDFARANGIKFLVCTHNYVNDWNWGVAASAFGPNRTTLVNNLVALVTRWNADGVDIDFEGNLAGDPNRTEYGAFIRELGTRLHAIGKELTVDVFPNEWNQPSMNWIGDWTGYVDGVNSMGYDALFGGGSGWQGYRWQQDQGLAAGYRCNQFDMGMPAWLGSWGSGGMGTSALAHVNELLSGSYNRQPTSVAIWDAQLNGSGWLSADLWSGLHALRMKACP